MAQDSINEDQPKLHIKEMGTAQRIEYWEGVKLYQVTFEDEFLVLLESKVILILIQLLALI
ncbi:MAG: hypothetical protein ACI9K1_000228 [Arcticibacterium sp.]|jgi:hypothetical protein